MEPVQLVPEIPSPSTSAPFLSSRGPIVQNFFPPSTGAVVNLGRENACFDTLGANNQGEPIGAYPCHGDGGSQSLCDPDKHVRNGQLVEVVHVQAEMCVKLKRCDVLIASWEDVVIASWERAT